MTMLSIAATVLFTMALASAQDDSTDYLQPDESGITRSQIVFQNSGMLYMASKTVIDH